MRVFVADDQVAVRSALRRLFFEEPGFVLVGEVDKVEELLSQIEAGQPDLVLLDWELPGLPPVNRSGRAERQDEPQSRSQLLNILQALQSRPKVVILSGRPEALQPALDAGADAFVCKGDPPDRLMQMLNLMKTLE